MHSIKVRNVNEAYTVGLRHLNKFGYVEESRGGSVITLPEPVCTTYTHPCERVLFNQKRDANPFFHFMEGLWMLAGRHDVEWISEYNGSLMKFSDNGMTFHGAYGNRWRHHFQIDGRIIDQIEKLIILLKRDPTTRRGVIQMWDPYYDLNREGLDFPCNLNVCFRIRERSYQVPAQNGERSFLDMTVYNRSNDIIWGAYGANAVHMSMLHEYIAGMIGMVPVGHYNQVSNDYHAYTDIMEKVGIPDPHPLDPYETGNVQTFPMIENIDAWDLDLFAFIHEGKVKAEKQGEWKDHHYVNPFFFEVAGPMQKAWRAYKKKDLMKAHNWANAILAPDWRLACMQWIIRRQERAADKTKRSTKVSL